MIADDNTPARTRPCTADAPLPLDASIRREGITIARSDADFVDVRRLWNAYAAWVSASIGVRLIKADPTFGAHMLDPRRVFSAPSAVLLARNRRHAIGTAALRVTPEGCAELHRFYLAPASRGLGIGRRLLSMTLEIASSLDVHTIDLHTAPAHMPAAVALYRMHGFETVREQLTHGVDLHMMRWTRLP